MDINQKILLKGIVADYKKDAKTKGIMVDKEHEDAFMELLETIDSSSMNQKEIVRKLVKFIIHQFISKPLVQKAIALYKNETNKFETKTENEE